MKPTHYYLFLFIFICLNVNGQRYVKSSWSTTLGASISIDHTASELYGPSQLIQVSNKPNLQSVDMVTRLINTEGNVVWESLYNHPFNKSAYGTAIAQLSDGKIIAAGAQNSSLNNVDWVIICYSPNGSQLWKFEVDYVGLEDIPIDIAINSSDEIIVTGFVTDSLNKRDFYTVKLDSLGSIVWTAQRDYQNEENSPLKCEFNGSQILITGGSSSSKVTGKIISILYSNDGIEQGLHLSSNGASLSFPTDLISFKDKGFVIVGQDSLSGKIVRLDSNLQEIWSSRFDEPDGNEIINSVTKDSSFNLYVCGSILSSFDEKLAFLAKYDEHGNQQWKKIDIKENNIESSAFRITILNSDTSKRVVVSGNQKDSNNLTRTYLTSFDLNGNIEWGPFTLNKREENIIEEIDGLHIPANNEIWVQTTLSSTSSGGSSQNKLYSITTYNRIKEYLIDSNGHPNYCDGEIIIQFNPNAIRSQVANNPNCTFGFLPEILDSIAFDSLTIDLQEWINTDSVIALKVHKELLPSDSLSLDRSGDTINLPPVWATYVLIFQESLDEDTLSLALHQSPYIEYVHPNFAYELLNTPNDPLYGVSQSGLIPWTGIASMTPSIDAENAWDLETGKKHIKIGIYDSGINWKHEDFKLNGKTKIFGGWDFAENKTAINRFYPDPVGHGTAVSGIAAALRNNNKGISGIAGGNSSNNEDYGCQLYSMKIINDKGNSFATDDVIASAIFDGSVSILGTNYGYGFHIANHSWATSKYSLILKGAFKIAARCGVINVCASGNSGINQRLYPASFNDDWILKVGASNSSGNRAGFSTYGYGLDFLAPGTIASYEVLHGTIASGYGNYLSNNPNLPANGTSLSAPHVTGSAGLMLSYHNSKTATFNNLDPEDVEHMLQKYSVDKSAVNYDNETGWGLIQIGSTMQHMKKNQYRIYHVEVNVNTSSASLYRTTTSLNLPESYEDLRIPNPYLTQVNVYKLTQTIHHNIPSGWIAIDAWVRNTSSTFFNPDLAELSYHQPSEIKLESYNQNQATLSGGFYEIWAEFTPEIVRKWTPVNNSTIGTFAYTLLLYNENALSQQELDKNNDVMMVMPNPVASGTPITASFNTSTDMDLDLVLIDMSGKTIRKFGHHVIQKGSTQIKIETEGLIPGLYFLQSKSPNGQWIQKLIISS
ncbi:S8 family serine peptidase [bacterium SCSIO 12741]|nr:S8 family serine peptidase [bacterium SCSIO 12741]